MPINPEHGDVCTGVHDNNKPSAEMCPVAAKRNRERKRERYRNDPEHRERERERNRVANLSNNTYLLKTKRQWARSTGHLDHMDDEIETLQRSGEWQT